MCARFSPQQVSHAVERGCGCVRARESAVKSSIAQSTAACAGPAFGGGPARRQPVPPQGAEALAFTGRRTMNTRGTRPGLSPTFYRWAEPSLTVQPLGTGRPLAISAVYRGPDFPRACSSSPDTDGVLQPRKSMTMLDLLAMEPAKAAPIPERNHILEEPVTTSCSVIPALEPEPALLPRRRSQQARGGRSGIDQPEAKDVCSVSLLENEDGARIAAKPLSCGRKIEAPDVVVVEIHLLLAVAEACEHHAPVRCV